MSAKPANILMKIWLAAFLVTLALVPVFLPTASLRGFYLTPNSHRLQRHSFRNVADGRLEAQSPNNGQRALPSLISGLTGVSFSPRPVFRSAPSSRLLSLLPHRRKLGRASPGDSDSLV
ncbi:MAG: hypothetical protein ACLQU2_18520 [Candidatus Binataceae bacterium]